MKILLTDGQFATVDVGDFYSLNEFRWCFKPKGNGCSGGYAYRWVKNNKRVWMHHEVIGIPKKGFVTDHINGDGLDNRRKNLRICTPSENLLNMGKNSRNTSGYKGVHFHAKLKKWRARIRVNGKPISLGVFSNKKDADKAYRNYKAKIKN